jgi:hypothetical protein
VSTATCRSCGADIIWVVSTNGKRMPLDALAQMRFVLSSAGDGTPPEAQLRETYVSHFSTCPNADKHRKAKP